MTTQLEPIELAPGTILGDEVYERIGTAILDGTLAPGQQLKDVELARQLGISRTPVREALQRLERFGLVEVAVGRYTRVSVLDDQLRSDTASFVVYAMGNALRMALKTCTDERLAAILEACDLVVEAAESGDQLALFDTSTALYELATVSTGNRMFIGVISEAQLAIRRNLRGWEDFVARPLENAAAYRGFREALAARDGDRAEATLRFLHGLDRRDVDPAPGAPGAPEPTRGRSFSDLRSAASLSRIAPGTNQPPPGKSQVGG